MKKNSTNLDKVIAKLAYKTSQNSANSNCRYFFYQPTPPEKVKKLRKF